MAAGTTAVVEETDNTPCEEGGTSCSGVFFELCNEAVYALSFTPCRSIQCAANCQYLVFIALKIKVWVVAVMFICLNLLHMAPGEKGAWCQLLAEETFRIHSFFNPPD